MGRSFLIFVRACNARKKKWNAKGLAVHAAISLAVRELSERVDVDA
jgi:hypothetical protein